MIPDMAVLLYPFEDVQTTIFALPFIRSAFVAQASIQLNHFRLNDVRTVIETEIRK